MGKIAIVYWSGTGNTQAMAELVAEGARAAGASPELFTAAQFSAEKAKEYTALALGCPSMGAEQLEETEFEPLYQSLKPVLGGKGVVLFGSYGWSGEAVGNLADRLKGLKVKLFEKNFRVVFVPTEEDLKQAKEFGKEFAATI